MTPTTSGASCPDIERLVGDALADRPGARARLDAHAETCDACAAEARLADTPDPDLLDALACLDGAVCPPAVVTAALTEARLGGARRAPAADRAPVAQAPRRAAWTRSVGALLLVGALALAWLRLGADAPTEAPLVAEQTPLAPEQVEPTPSEPTPVEPEPAASVEPDVTPAAPPPAAMPAPPPPARSTEAPLEAPLDLASAPTAADSAAARADLQFALAVLARANRATEAAVASEMRRLGEALAPTRVL